MSYPKRTVYEAYPIPEALFTSIAHAPAAQAVCALSLCTGMRAGEACALMWKDVRESEVSVTKMLFADEGERRYRPSGTLSLDERARRIFAELRACALERCGEISPRAFVFGDEEELGICEYEVKRWWFAHRDELGLPGTSVFDLRHLHKTASGKVAM